MVSKAKIDDRIYDVVNFDDYVANPSAYDSNFTAIVEGDTLYPIRGRNDTRPGLYPGNPFYRYVDPEEDEKKRYSSENIIDFDDVKSIKDVIEKQNKIKNAENAILTTVDNVFIPRIDENDSPEMVALKQAVIAKEIDLDKYEQRFGPNFNNDKRLFNRNTITLTKLKTMFDVLDMKATMIIEDKSPDVPNPIGRQVIVDLTNNTTDEGDDTDD